MAKKKEKEKKKRKSAPKLHPDGESMDPVAAEPVNPKSIQIWGLRESQKALIRQIENEHRRELQPLLRYQKHQKTMMLTEIKRECGIPDNIDVEYKGNEMIFVELPPQPHESDTTQDLTKTPA